MSRILAAALALSATICFPTRSAAQDADYVSFTLDDRGAVIVAVSIEGAGPFRFLVDTGSSRSAISEAVALKIAAPAIAQSEVVTPAGTALRPVVRITQVAVGTAVAATLAAMTIPDTLLKAAGPGVDGILGQDFLGPHNYTLDYRHRRLIWDMAPGGAPGTRLALVARDGRMIVELPQEDRTVVRLVPDSGTDGLVIFTRQGISPIPVDPSRQVTRLNGMLGGNQAMHAVIRQLKVGTITLRDQPAVTVARDDTDAPEADGLLPLHHFRSVTFGAGYVVFNR